MVTHLQCTVLSTPPPIFQSALKQVRGEGCIQRVCVEILEAKRAAILYTWQWKNSCQKV
jgi:hypothetical protein